MGCRRGSPPQLPGLRPMGRLSPAWEDIEFLWIPEGFAHGFVVLSETANVLYKTTDFYFPRENAAFAGMTQPCASHGLSKELKRHLSQRRTLKEVSCRMLSFLLPSTCTRPSRDALSFLRLSSHRVRISGSTSSITSRVTDCQSGISNSRLRKSFSPFSLEFFGRTAAVR